MTRGKSESLITPQSAVLLLLEGLLFTQNFMGCLKFVDSMGTIFPDWDNGRSLGLVRGEDIFRKLTPEEIEAEKMSESEVEDNTQSLELDNEMNMKM